MSKNNESLIAHKIAEVSKKECTVCEGIFQRNEQVYLNIYNQAFCAVCYKIHLKSED